MSTKPKSRSKKVTGFVSDDKARLAKLVDADVFAEAWNASATLKTFSENIGVSASTCATVAARLRKAGYTLKWFRKGRPRLLNL